MKRRGLIDPRVLSLVAELVTEILRAWAAHLSFFLLFLSVSFLSFCPCPLPKKEKKKVQKRALNSWDSLIHGRVSSARGIPYSVNTTDTPHCANSLPAPDPSPGPLLSASFPPGTASFLVMYP